MKFKELLTHYRESKGLSKTELAKKIHVSLPYIIALESGRQKAPTLNCAKKISSVLNLNDREKIELLQVAALERISKDDREVIEELLQTRLASQSKLSKEILKALQNPIAVKALLVTDKTNDDIKDSIVSMLNCLPSLSPEKRQAILALCK